MEAPPIERIETGVDQLIEQNQSNSSDIILLEPRVIDDYVQYSVLLPEALNQDKTAEGILFLNSFSPQRAYSLVLRGMIVLDNDDGIYYSHVVGNVGLYTHDIVCKNEKSCSEAIRGLQNLDWALRSENGKNKMVLPGMRDKPYVIKKDNDIAAKLAKFAASNRTCPLVEDQNPSELALLHEIYKDLSDMFANDSEGYIPFDKKRISEKNINFVPGFDPETLYGESTSGITPWFKFKH
jgi:hypothetical protein